MSAPRPVRVAVLSFLFNWPSTGGGNMHTAGLVDFLGRDGYEVRHFYARYPAWGIGRDEVGRTGDGDLGRADGGVGDPRRTGCQPGDRVCRGRVECQTIRQRFRAAVDSFAPDYVVISDSLEHEAAPGRGHARVSDDSAHAGPGMPLPAQ